MDFKKLIPIKELGEYRTGVLLIIAILYFTGYCTWLYLSWKMQLGPIQVLDSHYFLVGVPIVFIIFIFNCFRIISSDFFIKTWPSYYENRPSNFKTFSPLFLMLLLSLFQILLKIPILKSKIYFVLSVLLANIVLLLYIGTLEKVNSIMKGIHKKLVFFVVSITIIIAVPNLIRIYVDIVYPKIPFELGGIKPRNAYIDIPLQQLSHETLLKLGKGECSAQTEQIGPVSVVFLTKESVFIQNATCKKDSMRIIELPRKIINAFEWENKP